MKSGIFLMCLGALAPTQLIAIGMLIRYEVIDQSKQPKTEWLAVVRTALMTFAMLAIPVTMGVIILTRGK